jgi:hypothetical protein
MPEQQKQSFSPLSESNGLEPDMDLPEIIGDEWADPEEFLNDYCSDDAEAENAARKHLD